MKILAPKTRILMVCLGNICRSPTAEGVFLHVLKREAPTLNVAVDSAGTAGYHIGAPPDARSQRHALLRGIDLSGLRARQLAPEDYRNFDLILAMDGDNLATVNARQPRGATARLQLFMDYAPELGEPEVPDPYYGGDSEFEHVLDLTQAAARGLIRALQQRA
jgi:protein-tyrosine phosphatase